MAEKPPMAYQMLYTLGVLAELKQDGFLDGPDLLTESGIEAFNRLRESGFSPTAEELTKCLDFIDGFYIPADVKK